MVKSELVQKLADLYPTLLRKDIIKIVDIILLEIMEALCRDESVEIRNFGRFSPSQKKARLARIPRNSEIVKVPAKNAIKWKMSKILFKKLNNNFTENKISANN